VAGARPRDTRHADLCVSGNLLWSGTAQIGNVCSDLGFLGAPVVQPASPWGAHSSGSPGVRRTDRDVTDATPLAAFVVHRVLVDGLAVGDEHGYQGLPCPVSEVCSRLCSGLS
jgi:hypothetical protein